MSDERKPFCPWIVALLIWLPVLYVASFGPAYCVWWKVPLPRRVGRVVLRFYAPLIWLGHNSDFVGIVWTRYHGLFLDYSTPPQNLEID
jgi:hypothetical protein